MKRAILVVLSLALGPAVGAILAGRAFVPQHLGTLMLGGLVPLLLLTLVARIGGRIARLTFCALRQPRPLGQSGAAMAEFVIVIIPFLLMLFALMQLSLAALARVLVAYAAFCAARAAIVFVPMSGGQVSSVATIPGEASSNEATNALGTGSDSLNDLGSSKKAELIRNAAAYAMIPASPPIDTFLGDAAATWASYLGQRLAAGADPTNYLNQTISGLPSLPPTIVSDLTSVMNAANQGGLDTAAQRAAAQQTVDNWLEGAISDPTLRSQIAQSVSNYYNGTGGSSGANSANGALGTLVNSTIGNTLSGNLDQYVSQIEGAPAGNWKGYSVDRALDSGMGSTSDVSGALLRSLRKLIYARLATAVTLTDEEGNLKTHFGWGDPIRANVTYLFYCQIPLANLVAGKPFYSLGNTTLANIGTGPMGSFAQIGLPGFYMALTANHTLVNQGTP